MTLYHPTQRRPVSKFGGLGDVTCPEGYAVYPGTGQCTQVPGYRIQKVLGDYLQAAQLGQYGIPPPSPDQMASMLSSEAANICAQTFIPCDGSEQSILQAYVQWYTAWYTQNLASFQAQQTQTGSGGGSGNTLNNVAPPGPSITPSLVINNASGGSNTQFRVGDVFRLVITGPPNSPVDAYLSQNGVNHPMDHMGMTDASGTLVISGTLTPDSIGSWVEGWYVGGKSAGNITFSVVAASALNPPQGTNTNVNPGTITNNQSPPPAASGTTQQTTVVNASGNWFTDKTTLGSVEIPNYLLVGGAGLALLLVVGSKG